MQRKLPIDVLERESERFSLYEKVLSQKINDKNKIYSLHEADIYCVGKGKDHKAYEYGRKASVVATLKSKVIVGVKSHEEHTHDSATLKPAIEAAEKTRQTQIETAVVDRGYRGAKSKVDVEVIIPNRPLKRDSRAMKQRKRNLCRKRSAIEPIIGHLKLDYRLGRSYLKGSAGDEINLLMAACAWNLRKWLVTFFLLEFKGDIYVLCAHVDEHGQFCLILIKTHTPENLAV